MIHTVIKQGLASVTLYLHIYVLNTLYYFINQLIMNE